MRDHDNRAIHWDIVTQTGREHNKGCAGCRYVTHEFYCDYLLQEGRRRPCKPYPGGGCPIKDATQRDPRCHPGYLFSRRQKKKIVQSKRVPKNTLDRSPLAAELYEKGANDLQIAMACGCSKQTVLKWRKRTGRKSHWHNRRKELTP